MYSSQGVYVSFTYFIYILCADILFFIKHGVLHDYKAPPASISKDSYAMIQEMRIRRHRCHPTGQQVLLHSSLETVRTCDYDMWLPI